MKLIIKILLITITCNFLVYSQNLTRIEKIHLWKKIDYKIIHSPNPSDKLRERWQKLFEEIFGVDDTDIIEADKVGAGASRLFPASMGMMVDDNSMSDIIFPNISEYFQADFTYFKDSFVFGYGIGLNHGFIIDLGKTSIDKINQNTPQVKSLTKYKSPSDSKDIKQNLTIDGFYLKSKVPVIISNTYLCLSVIYPNHGGIYAVKVIREDSDKSIIIFRRTIKLLKPFERDEYLSEENSNQSQPPPQTDVDRDKIEKALRKAGFKNVLIDISTTPATLRGTVPKGKSADMVKVAQEAAGKPVKNETTEYNKIKRKKIRKKLQ